MNKFHFIFIILLATFHIQAINNDKITASNDSTLFFFHHKGSPAQCKVGEKIISRREGFKLLLSYPPSAYEFKKGQKIGRPGLAFIGGSLLAFAIPSFICLPVSFASLTVGIIMLRRSNKHLRKSIELYNRQNFNSRFT